MKGPNVTVLIPISNKSNDCDFLKTITFGGKGIPEDYDVSEELIPLRDKLAKDDPYEEIGLLQ